MPTGFHRDIEGLRARRGRGAVYPLIGARPAAVSSVSMCSSSFRAPITSLLMKDLLLAGEPCRSGDARSLLPASLLVVIVTLIARFMLDRSLGRSPTMPCGGF